MEKEFLLQMYRKMLLIRKFDSRSKELDSLGKIPGGVHCYTGQEAVAVGVCICLQKDDYVLSTHRGHGHCIAKGLNPSKVMAEFFGKMTGYSKGKGGQQHIAYPPLGLLATNGIVGGTIPISVGVGLSIKLRGTDQVVVAFFGDGAVDQGVFHESLNLASLWKLPVVFVCENNFYQTSTHVSKHLSSKSVADFSIPYQMLGFVVDGNDALAVYKAASEAIGRAREGKGPTLLECQTYRWDGHWSQDPWTTYRSVQEVEEWKKKCPIKRFKTKLLEMKVLTDEELEEIEREVDQEIENAVKFAEESPWPGPEEALQDVFVSQYY